MNQNQSIVAIGRWLFSRRSYLPALFATLFVPAFSLVEYPRNHYCLQHMWEFYCLGLSLAGLTIRSLTVAHIREGSSDRGLVEPGGNHLNTSGIYSLVRNPLYLGNGLIWLGIVNLLRLWWLSVGIMIIFFIYYRIIIYSEEAYLQSKFGSQFLAWAGKTPVLIPALGNWQKPEYPFSLVMIVRREYSGLFQIFAAYAIMNVLIRHAVEGKWIMDPFWQKSLSVVTLFCLCVFFLLRQTNFLSAPSAANDSDVQSSINSH